MDFDEFVRSSPSWSSGIRGSARVLVGSVFRIRAEGCKCWGFWGVSYFRGGGSGFRDGQNLWATGAVEANCRLRHFPAVQHASDLRGPVHDHGAHGSLLTVFVLCLRPWIGASPWPFHSRACQGLLTPCASNEAWESALVKSAPVVGSLGFPVLPPVRTRKDLPATAL